MLFAGIVKNSTAQNIRFSSKLETVLRETLLGLHVLALSLNGMLARARLCNEMSSRCLEVDFWCSGTHRLKELQKNAKMVMVIMTVVEKMR